MTQDILLDIQEEGIRLAVLENGTAVGYFSERDAASGQNGSIYRGKILQVIPGLQAAFIDIGLGLPGFLHVGDVQQVQHNRFGEPVAAKGKNTPIEQLLKAGQELTVQIVREAFGDKGPKLTTRWTLPGHAVLILPNTDAIGVSKKIQNEAVRKKLYDLVAANQPVTVGVVVRTMAEQTAAETLVDEMQHLSRVVVQIQENEKKGAVPRLLYAENGMHDFILRTFRNENTNQIFINDVAWYEKIRAAFIAVNPSWALKVRHYGGDFSLFALHGVETDLARALSRKVWLKSGAVLHFDNTEAMTVIDVNTGKYTGKSDAQETFEKINLEAVETIAQQLRLRNIGGIVVIDFIDMKSMDAKNKLLEALRTRLEACDPGRSMVAGMTTLGLVEMTRKRLGQPLYKALKEKMPLIDERIMQDRNGLLDVGDGQVEGTNLETEVIDDSKTLDGSIPISSEVKKENITLSETVVLDTNPRTMTTDIPSSKRVSVV